MLNSLLHALDEREIARRLTIHDQVRMSYRLDRTTVSSFPEFESIIGEYYKYHHDMCVSPGGNLSMTIARSKAKSIILAMQQERNPSIHTTYYNCLHGTNGGLRITLDYIADGIKRQTREEYIRDVFDRTVQPIAWSRKVTLIRELMQHYGPELLPPDLRNEPPERFAHSYEELITNLSRVIGQMSNIFRKD